ncbi:MAG: 50S ribosomal protein L24 [Candidatus Sulfotelmatobacter sp.]|jgi:large subunit ribosomal protein L24
MAKVAYQRRQEKGERQPHRIKIRKDDVVKVISGRDKGKTGRVLEVDRLSGKLTVEGVMVVKRHTRPNPSRQVKGGIAEKPMPIHVSKVMMLNSAGEPTRIGYKLESAGGDKVRRVRVARKGGDTLDKR